MPRQHAKTFAGPRSSKMLPGAGSNSGYDFKIQHYPADRGDGATPMASKVSFDNSMSTPEKEIPEGPKTPQARVSSHRRAYDALSRYMKGSYLSDDEPDETDLASKPKKSEKDMISLKRERKGLQANLFPKDLIAESELRRKQLEYGGPFCGVVVPPLSLEEQQFLFPRMELPIPQPQGTLFKRLSLDRFCIELQKENQAAAAAARAVRRQSTMGAGPAVLNRRLSTMAPRNVRDDGDGPPVRGRPRSKSKARRESVTLASQSAEAASQKSEAEEKEKEEDAEGAQSHIVSCVMSSKDDYKELVATVNKAIEESSNDEGWERVRKWRTGFQEMKTDLQESLAIQLDRRSVAREEALRSNHMLHITQEESALEVTEAARLREIGDLTSNNGLWENIKRVSEEAGGLSESAELLAVSPAAHSRSVLTPNATQQLNVAPPAVGIWEQTCKTGKMAKLEKRVSFYAGLVEHIERDGGGLASKLELQLVNHIRKRMIRGMAVDKPLFYALIEWLGDFGMMDSGVVYIMQYVRQACDIETEEMVAWLESHNWAYSVQDVQSTQVLVDHLYGESDKRSSSASAPTITGTTSVGTAFAGIAGSFGFNLPSPPSAPEPAGVGTPNPRQNALRSSIKGANPNLSMRMRSRTSAVSSPGPVLQNKSLDYLKMDM